MKIVTEVKRHECYIVVSLESPTNAPVGMLLMALYARSLTMRLDLSTVKVCRFKHLSDVCDGEEIADLKIAD